jgi:hypothetical protein
MFKNEILFLEEGVLERPRSLKKDLLKDAQWRGGKGETRQAGRSCPLKVSHLKICDPVSY